MSAGGIEEEEEDYEPNFQPTEDPEQIRNKNDALPPEDALQTPTELALGPFKLPQPPPLTPEETEEIGKGTISRVFSMMNVLDEPLTAKRQKPGLNRLAGSSYDREAWITVITRLATRASAGLEDDSGDEEEDESQALTKSVSGSSLGEGIRETLWKYIIEDFRARMAIAISWLNEEWYNDRLQAQATSGQLKSSSKRPKQQEYDKWVLKVLDGILPYLEPKDKVLIRFLSEIPAVDYKILERVKSLAKDPERVSLAVNAIQ
jgi:symplekin